MSPLQPHTILANCQVLIMPMGSEAALESIKRTCSQAGLRVFVARTVEEMDSCLQQHPTGLAVILSGDWENLETGLTLAHLRTIAPDTAILLQSEGPTPSLAQLQKADVLGVITPADSPEAAIRWINAALEITVERRALATARQDIHDLRRFSEEASNCGSVPMDGLLQAVLRMALGVAGREMRYTVDEPLSGAVLALDNNGQFTTRVTTGPDSEALAVSAQGELRYLVQHSAEQRSIRTIDNMMIVPIFHGERTYAVLLMAGARMPSVISDILMALMRHVAVIIENSTLRELSTTDAVTRTYNHSFILQRLYESVKMAYRTRQDLSVLLLDIDLSRGNETYSHFVSDQFLRELGETLSKSLRETDILGRYRSTCFLVVLPDTPFSGGLQVAGRLQRNAEAFRLTCHGTEITAGVHSCVTGIKQREHSIEVFRNRPGSDFFHKVMEALLAQAEESVTRAKREGSPTMIIDQPLDWAQLHMQYDLPVAECTDTDAMR